MPRRAQCRVKTNETVNFYSLLLKIIYSLTLIRAVQIYIAQILIRKEKLIILIISYFKVLLLTF